MSVRQVGQWCSWQKKPNRRLRPTLWHSKTQKSNEMIIIIKKKERRLKINLSGSSAYDDDVKGAAPYSAAPVSGCRTFVIVAKSIFFCCPCVGHEQPQSERISPSFCLAMANAVECRRRPSPEISAARIPPIVIDELPPETIWPHFASD